jgi:hypothetical protein
MAKTKISEWSATPANNTDIDNINIAEGCAPSGINDAIREMMAQIKDLYAGTSGDIIAVAAGGTGVGTSTGSGSNVLSTSPTLVTPALGTPSALVGTNITGTATSFNINGTVGATTPTTGAFTTLAASGAVTLSGGTANGVAYLNGSKVVTSGSALVFDGTNLGIAASSPTAKLHIGGNTASTQQAIFSTGVSDSDFKVVARNGVSGSTAVQGYIGLDYANGTWPLLAGVQFIRNSTSGELAFTAGTTTSASEQMRLTSTGLALGTSSFAGSAKLQVAGGRAYFGSNDTVYSINLAYNNTRALAGQGYYLGSTDSATPSLVFSNTDGTARATLDYAGNLGLGVTPSAWIAYKAFQFGSGTADGSLSSAGDDTNLSTNAYYATGGVWKYQSAYKATRYTQSGGSHVWSTAGTGTAGNAITFTQALTLFASGGLSLGNTTDAGAGAFSAKSTSAAHLFDSNSGTEVIGISKASGNKAYLATVSNTDSGLQVKDSSGSITLTVGTNGKSVALQGGTVVTGTGISFPATQSASTDANTLDDYEEGTYTPTVVGSVTTGTGTYSIQAGSYTKIGNRVDFTTVLSWSAHTGTGNLIISGLPFTQSGTYRFSYSIVGEILTYVGQLVALNNGTDTSIALFSQVSATGLVNVAMDTSVSYLVITGTYNI